jgi:hypothetical protein
MTADMAVAGSGGMPSGDNWTAGVHCTPAVRNSGGNCLAGGEHWCEENGLVAQDCSSSHLVSDHHTVLGYVLQNPDGNIRHMVDHDDHLYLCLHQGLPNLHREEGRASKMDFDRRMDSRSKVQQPEAAVAEEGKSIGRPSWCPSRCALGRGNW